MPYSAIRGDLATDLVSLKHDQVTRTTSELVPSLLTSTPHQQEKFSALTYLTCIGPLYTAGVQWNFARNPDTPGYRGQKLSEENKNSRQLHEFAFWVEEKKICT
ncbi:hypothetical protein TNCV_3185731 [Trichonephila clavipes]|nr:hypothetical protein TNCV_3185731 [Trichonephila clavipes]